MEQPTPEIPSPLDWSKWPGILTKAVSAAAVVLLAGMAFYHNSIENWLARYLVGYMFCLSIGLGGLFLVLAHHLFDANWSVPIRRINEHLACLLPWMAVFWIPIGIWAPDLYAWMDIVDHPDHALAAKQSPLPLFTLPGFYISSALCFIIWWYIPNQLRRLSLEQDKTGAADCTFQMRKFAFLGIFLFAFSLTLAALMWMKGLQHAWFSTMYGVYYFAASVWTTIVTVYMIVLLLHRQGNLKDVITGNQYYYLGTLFLAFTVFYSYIHFSQYFIIWNGNVPEETFWYAQREAGAWKGVCYLLIFGHFFIPFLALLRIDRKLNFNWMTGLFVWALCMHFVDMYFNIIPVVNEVGEVSFPLIELASVIVIGGVLAMIFRKNFNSHPPYPQRDPRMAECLGVYIQPLSEQTEKAAEGAK